MAKPLETVLQHLRQWLGRERAGGMTDRQLLHAFSAGQDDTAFTALMRRHGPMVLAVCRRVLGDAHEAEDAFQGAFFVLARKAGSISWKEEMGNWLYGVAYRIASKAKVAAARRHKREQEAMTMHSEKATEENHSEELRSHLDIELHRLPAKFRMPLVLHYLEGRTKEETARELGWSEGTVSSRLARGRDMLRERLTKRGLALPGAAFAGVLAAQSAPAAVSATLADATLKASLLFAAGQAAGISAGAIIFAEGALQTMFWNKIKIAAALVLTLGVTGSGGALLVQQTLNSRPSAEAKAEVPSKKNEVRNVDLYGDPLPEGAVARLGALRFRHDSRVISIALSPDKKTLASTTGVNVLLWDTATGKEIRRFTDVNPSCLAYSPDGKILVAAGKILRFWEAATAKEIRTIQLEGNEHPDFNVTNVLVFSPNGKTLATTSTQVTGFQGAPIRIWDVDTGKALRQLPCCDPWYRIWSIAFSSDGKTLAVGNCSMEGDIDLWETATWKKRAQFPSDRNFLIRHLAFSPNGRILACSENRTGIFNKSIIRFRELPSGKELRQIRVQQGEGDGAALVFSPEGEKLISGNCVWDVASGQKILAFTDGPSTHPEPLNATSFSSDGKILATGILQDVQLWDVSTGNPLRPFQGHQGRIWSVAFSPDGKLLASSGHREDNARLWEIATGKETSRFLVKQNNDLIVEVAFSNDGQTVAVGNDLWDVSSGKLRRRLSPIPGSSEIAFSPDGKLMACQSPLLKDVICLYDIGKGQMIKFLKIGNASIFAVSPNETHLATAVMDEEARKAGTYSYVISLWEITTGKKVRELGRNLFLQRSMQFSPDGAVLAAHLSKSILLWNVETGKELLQIQHEDNQCGCAAFSPDSRFLAHDDRLSKEIVIRSVSTGKEIRRLKGHANQGIMSLAFSPDGKLLASGGNDTTILLWDVSDLKK